MKYIAIDVDNPTMRHAYVWARENFGMSKPEGVRFCDMRWYQRDLQLEPYRVTRRFYFKNPEDATMFALRWA